MLKWAEYPGYFYLPQTKEELDGLKQALIGQGIDDDA